MYVGDESGGTVLQYANTDGKKMEDYYNTGAGAEFRKKAYEFAIDHGAFGVDVGGALRANDRTPVVGPPRVRAGG